MHDASDEPQEDMPDRGEEGAEDGGRRSPQAHPPGARTRYRSVWRDGRRSGAGSGGSFGQIPSEAQ
eukprot:6041976-Amphidinium_carterae.1